MPPNQREAKIPNTIDRAFYNCTSLINITIPESVTSIGGSAFYNCTSLININIPDSVTSIGDGAFRYCNNLTSLKFENPNGWYCKKYSWVTRENIPSEALQNPENAAKYLKDTYCDCYWERKTT